MALVEIGRLRSPLLNPSMPMRCTALTSGGGDEVVVVTWLRRADRSTLKEQPSNDVSQPLTGVFATRSPGRPDPLGLHRVRVPERSGVRLRVGLIEAADRARRCVPAWCRPLRRRLHRHWLAPEGCHRLRRPTRSGRAHHPQVPASYGPSYVGPRKPARPRAVNDSSRSHPRVYWWAL